MKKRKLCFRILNYFFFNFLPRNVVFPIQNTDFFNLKKYLLTYLLTYPNFFLSTSSSLSTWKKLLLNETVLISLQIIRGAQKWKFEALFVPELLHNSLPFCKKDCFTLLFLVSEMQWAQNGLKFSFNV